MAPLLPTMYKSEHSTHNTSFARMDSYLPANFGAQSAFGRQESGPLPNCPSYGFARTDRLQAGRPFHSDHHTEHSHAEHEYEGRSEFRRPGPGSYDKDQPSKTLGRSGLRADFSRGIGRERLPAPAHHPFRSVDRFSTLYSSMGRQLLKPSESRASFKGVITRAQREKVYAGPEFEKAQFGAITPGPGALGRFAPGIGKQVDSVKVTAPRATFGSAPRITSLDGVDRQRPDPAAPGPNSYHSTQRFTRAAMTSTRGAGGR